MGQHFVDILACLHDALRLRADACLAEALPDVADCLLRRMDHIVGIETVIAKFVRHNLIGGKVGNTPGEIVAQPVHCQE